jgi:hypothetical protein
LLTFSLPPLSSGKFFPLLAVWASCRAEPVRLHVVFVARANLPIGADVSGLTMGYWFLLGLIIGIGALIFVAFGITGKS